ncbi:MAG: hypothetical protein LBG74_03485 [Spirochaetaceae bacterium]|jgi:hypothetical protein|nr:hypothetical protein [Spirochaetaceae bacterium]
MKQSITTTIKSAARKGGLLTAAGTLLLCAAAIVLVLAGCDNGNGPPESEPDIDFGHDSYRELTVSSLDEWNEAKATISDGGNNKNYVINVSETVTGITGDSYATFGSGSGIKVSLRGAEKFLVLGSTGTLIKVPAGHTVIVRGVSLEGRGSDEGYENNSPLVCVEEGGTFTLADGKIGGNNANVDGSGVQVQSGGTFTMSGGTIWENTTGYSGGGVYVSNSGTFTMSGGDIKRNTAGYSGGGVCVYGTFTKTGGTIYGKDADASEKNTADAGEDTKGHAVFVPDTDHYRDTTAGPSVNLSVVAGAVSGAGWNQ